MGFLSDTIQGGLDLLHKYDPLDSAIFNGMLKTAATSVREIMNSSEHLWDDLERSGPGFQRGIAGGLRNNSEHWSVMAQRDIDDPARQITNAGLTLASLFGAYYGAANPSTIGGAFGSGYAGGSVATAAKGGDQDQIAKGGLIGGASSAAGQYVGSNSGSPALGGATRGGLGALANGGNMGRGALSGALGSQMPDVGTSVGITDPELNKAFNSSLQSGLTAKVNGGNVRSAAIGGAAPGLVGYGASQMDDYGTGYDPIKSASGAYSSPAPWSQNYNSATTPTPWSSNAGGFTPATGGESQGNPLKDMFKTGVNWLGDTMGAGINAMGGRQAFGDTMQGLAGLYGGWRQRKQANELMNRMGLNRQAYQDQLRKNLMARDAAAGKRSDYGGRETQLMSSLAELDARNGPAMMQLSNMGLGGGLAMLGSGLKMGADLGAFGPSFMRQQPGMAPMRAPNYQPMSLPSLYQPQAQLGNTYDPMNWDHPRRIDQFGG